MTEPPQPPLQPIRFYTDEELDELEVVDPDRAFRIARAQAMAARNAARNRVPVGDGTPPDPARVREAVGDVQQILRRDGGDIELVDIDGSVVRVRMKGACVGCPNAVIDLKNVVEKVLLGVPGVSAVQNTF